MNARKPSLQDWWEDPAARAKWRQMWNDPVMQFGLAVLMNLGIPQSRKIIVGSTGNLEAAAMQQAASGGYWDALRNIEALKDEPPTKREASVSDEFWGEAPLVEPGAEAAPTKPKRSRKKTQ